MEMFYLKLRPENSPEAKLSYDVKHYRILTQIQIQPIITKIR